jgi:hypothetical protein
MPEKTSPFVRENKPWFIRKIISDYFRAKNMFENMNRELGDGREPNFDKLKKLSDILFKTKEDLYLIFRKLINPDKHTFEKIPKAIPNENEIEFMNNVGLLFHKTMVARELQYVLDHYAINSQDYNDTKHSLETYWERMDELFKIGTELAKLVLIKNSESIEVLAYLVEHKKYVEDALGEDIKNILEIIEGKDNIDLAYYKVGCYCLESGWQDRAKKNLGEAIKINPENRYAQTLMKQVVNHLR